MRISHSGGCKAAAGEGEHHLYESEDLNHGLYGGGDLEELVFNVGLFCSYWTMTDPLFLCASSLQPPRGCPVPQQPSPRLAKVYIHLLHPERCEIPSDDPFHDLFHFNMLHPFQMLKCLTCLGQFFISFSYYL